MWKTEVSARDEYLRAVNAGRRLAGGDYTDREDDKARDEELAGALEHPEFTEMALEEEFILTVTADGMGKRTSAYDYRISKRGGKGIDSIDPKRGEGTLDGGSGPFPFCRPMSLLWSLTVDN